MSDIEKTPRVEIVKRESLAVEFLNALAYLCTTGADYFRALVAEPPALTAPEPEENQNYGPPVDTRQAYRDTMRQLKKGHYR